MQWAGISIGEPLLSLRTSSHSRHTRFSRSRSISIPESPVRSEVAGSYKAMFPSLMSFKAGMYI